MTTTGGAVLKSSRTERTDSASIPGLEPAPTRHAKLVAWVKEIAALTRPDRVYWCDGSDAEFDRILRLSGEKRDVDRLPPARALADAALVEVDDAETLRERWHQGVPERCRAAEPGHQNEIAAAAADGHGQARAVGELDNCRFLLSHPGSFRANEASLMRNRPSPHRDGERGLKGLPDRREGRRLRS